MDTASPPVCKGGVSPQCLHNPPTQEQKPYKDVQPLACAQNPLPWPPGALRELLAPEARPSDTQIPSWTPHPVIQFQNSCSHGTQGSFSHGKQCICSSCMSLCLQHWGIARASCLSVFSFGNLNTGAHYGAGEGQCLRTLSRCATLFQPSRPVSKAIGLNIYSFDKIP